jgi:hypothetical protein
MIIFIASFPALSDDKDGMVQRIASIDSLISDLPRIYLDISFRRFWFKRVSHFPNVVVFQLNGFLHFFAICSMLKKSRVVYIHSIYNSMRALSAYWLAKPITDLHGVVPEELFHAGKLWRARILNLIECIVLRRNMPLIHVTSAMQRHFLQKYKRGSKKDRVIPILPRLEDARGERDHVIDAERDASSVIYAGGLQTWQNISLMLEKAAASPLFRYVFLSGESSTLTRMVESIHVANYECISVSPKKVADYYLKCTYGFVLRDPILLNQVACPTKLVEYLYWGVVPIVLTPNIGDFAELGFAYILLDDFCAGRLPDSRAVSEMRLINRNIAEYLLGASEGALADLKMELAPL